MSNEAKLGTIPTGIEGRDAVHIAIVPVKAAKLLYTGWAVTLNKDGEAEPIHPQFAVGVVDPFGPDSQVHAGQWFWLCLYPKTTTGLRHVWEHPAFKTNADTAEACGPGQKGQQGPESMKWLEAYVREHCGYDEGLPDGGLSKFLRSVEHDCEIFYHGSDCHSLEDVDDRDELFRHLSVVLGRRIDAGYFKGFNCSC